VSAYLRDAEVDVRGVDVAVAVVAELFTNALIHHEVHGDEHVDVAVRVCAEPTEFCVVLVVLAVTDGGRGTISGACDPHGSADEHGRGLQLVCGLGALISDELLETGYRVTAAFPVDAALRGQLCSCAASRADAHGVCPHVAPPIVSMMGSAQATRVM
jgi:anti-sigma regulatory factor (Ser/Thr protein kinase)